MGFYVTAWRADINPSGQDLRGTGAAPTPCKTPPHLAKRPPNFPAKACKAAARLCICSLVSSPSPSAGKGVLNERHLSCEVRSLSRGWSGRKGLAADGKQHGCCVLGPVRRSSQGSGICSVNYSQDATGDFYYPANSNF